MISDNAILDLLVRAGLTAGQREAAMQCFRDAQDRARGLLWHKFKTRYIKARSLAKRMTWEAERLIDIDPSLLTYDVAPAINVKILGDFFPWVWTPAGDRPTTGQWLNPDPSSEEYQLAARSNLWTKGVHPRTRKSHIGAIRRNGGEGEAYLRGRAVNVANARVFRGRDVAVFECDGAWQLNANTKILGVIPVRVRLGYEISNLWRETDAVQLWHMVPGYELRAPLTCSVMPGHKKV